MNGASDFEMVYQPICRLADRTIIGYEALARFPKLEGVDPADQSPDVWFRDAARYDLGPELEALAIACGLSALPVVHPCYVAVNVSVETLLTPDLAMLLLGGVPNVVVELTENEVMYAYRPLLEVLEVIRVRKMMTVAVSTDGARLAIDDLGSGHSGLTRVVELQPDILKLDRGLISDIDTNTVKGALVAGMVIFAAAADMSLIAEGVETEAESEALQTLGVEYGQGWLLGRPVALEGAGRCRGPL